MTQNLSVSGNSVISPMTDDEVRRALMKLWFRSRWTRLEIGRAGDGCYTGYCIDGKREYMTAAALGDPSCPEAITRLAGILDVSGWRRLEIMTVTGGHAAGGWCERADGSGLHVRF